ncbi:cysteine-rich small domain-containing protein [Patescibacteria group bacterium]
MKKDDLKEYRYENRIKKDPKACPCYKTNAPCHKIENLNCFLCYCPEYDTSKKEGGCKRNSPDGKWFYHEKLPKGKIWDCSDCTYPHEEKNIEKYLKK